MEEKTVFFQVKMLNSNFYEWIDQVFDGRGLPCTSKVKNSHGTGHINGYYRHFSDTEANLFSKHFQKNGSCGSVKQYKVGESALSGEECIH